MKYSFLNDYSEGCHPSILDALVTSNNQQELGYGQDNISSQATHLIKGLLDNNNVDVHFVTAGTQANLICVAAMLKPFEAIVSATSGHIAANEAGAIEATGHKIISMPSDDGKLTVQAITDAIKQFSLHPHMVKIKAVYISNATEKGTIYTKAELTALYHCCKQNDLYLFMDGARLGVALASRFSDMNLSDVSKLTDMFWLGGTKMGALCGEAIIINNDALKQDFAFYMKQHGALLAKGRLLATQFACLLKDNLYLELSTHANSMAEKIADAIEDAGYQLADVTQSNQVFAILPNKLVKQLSQSFIIFEWQPLEDNTTLVRIVTSWATDTTQVEKFITAIKQN